MGIRYDIAIRGNQIVDIAVLIHVDLRVPRAWAERAHHDGGPALLAAEKFGNRIDVLDGKPDECGARGHPADLF